MFGGSTRMISAEGTWTISATRSMISCHFWTMSVGIWTRWCITVAERVPRAHAHNLAFVKNWVKFIAQTTEGSWREIQFEFPMCPRVDECHKIATRDTR